MKSGLRERSQTLGSLKNTLFPKKIWNSDLILIGYVSLFSLMLHLIAIKGYGYFRDELYYIACSDRLDFGYVDQPSLSILLLKLVRLTFGDSIIALRILPILGGALLVFLTGIIARELGGRKFAVVLASTVAFANLGNFFIFNFYSMNFLDILFWQTCILILILIIKTGKSQYWIMFGLVAGLGFENKISILFFLLGISAGILLTRQRKHLKSPYFWFGITLIILLAIPYVLWNLDHNWPTLEFMYNAKTYKMSDVSPLGFFMNQVLFNNPINLLIWIPGILFFFFHREGRKYRLFGWMFLFIYILFTLIDAKDYYLAGAYPVLFAGGALLWEKALQARRWRRLKPASIILIIVTALVLCPMSLPILSVEHTMSIMRIWGLKHDSGEIYEEGLLPQYYADMHGWEEMVDMVAKVYQGLSSEEQSKCAIHVNNYGEAGAIDLFGKKYGLPRAISPHNNYWIWGPGNWNGDVAIFFGSSRGLEWSKDNLELDFEEVEHVATFTNKYVMSFENNLPIFICRRYKHSIKEMWVQHKSFI